MKNCSRDIRFDIIKGISIILVFWGHIFQHSFENFAKNPIFNIIWALQIPLFMFVAGYFCVTNSDAKSLDFKKIGKRTFAYLLPFFSYFYIVKIGILGAFDRNIVTATSYLSSHLESSLWFLWVVFVFYVMFTIADVIHNNFKSTFMKLAMLFLSLLVLLIPWIVIALKIGTAFLGAKYVIYYSVFYCLGILLKKYKIIISKVLANHIFKKLIYVISLFIFTIIVFNSELHSKHDTLLNVFLRLISGFTGIIVVGSMCLEIKNASSKICNYIIRLGEKTLQIYFSHMLLLPILRKIDIPIFSVDGIVILVINTIIIGIFTYGIIKIIELNTFTNFIFFGKSIKR